jgi:glutamyl endopeptidase
MKHSRTGRRALACSAAAGLVGALSPTAPSSASGQSVAGVDGDILPTIIGTDGRDEVSNTTVAPYKWVAIIMWSNGASCTGFLYDSDTLATAGHCVYDTDENEWMRALHGNPAVILGYNGTSKPYGICYGTASYSNETYTVNEDKAADYGALKLDCTMSIGDFNMTDYEKSEEWAGFAHASSGYSGDYVELDPEGGFSAEQMKKGSDAYGAQINDDRRIKTPLDIVGGDSGSPSYDPLSPYNTNAIMTQEFSTYNVATRIYHSRRDLYVGWM